MSQKQIILVICIGLVLFGGVFLLLNMHPRTPVSQTPVLTPTPLPSTPQTILNLKPNPAEPDSQGDIDLYVSADTRGNKITAVEFELAYDPTALTFVSIEPDDAFYHAQELINEVDTQKGTIHYAVGLTAQQRNEPVQGNDHAVEIAFRPKHGGETKVRFLKAIVSAPGVATSVLKETNDTTVHLQLIPR